MLWLGCGVKSDELSSLLLPVTGTIQVASRAYTASSVMMMIRVRRGESHVIVTYCNLLRPIMQIIFVMIPYIGF